MDSSFWKTFALGGVAALALFVVLHKLGWE